MIRLLTDKDSDQQPRALPLRRLILDARVLVQVLQLMNGPQRLRCKGLPGDARVVAVATAIDLPHTVVIMLESQLWPLVPAGSEVPILSLEIAPYYQDTLPGNCANCGHPAAKHQPACIVDSESCGCPRFREESSDAQ